jgi:hypothetical protein
MCRGVTVAQRWLKSPESGRFKSARHSPSFLHSRPSRSQAEPSKTRFPNPSTNSHEALATLDDGGANSGIAISVEIERYGKQGNDKSIR